MCNALTQLSFLYITWLGNICNREGAICDSEPTWAKYPTFGASTEWIVEAEALNVGYLDH